MCPTDSFGHVDDTDITTIERVVEGHPIRFAVLFGSHARGTQTAFSDVDIAVEFEESVSDEDRTRIRLDLIVQLIEALGTDEVDVAVLDSIRPEIGFSAVRDGVVLTGSDDRANQLLKRFARRKTSRTHTDRMRQFDELISRLEEHA
jgi:predicted nucleotidyltransferase